MPCLPLVIQYLDSATAFFPPQLLLHYTYAAASASPLPSPLAAATFPLPFPPPTVAITFPPFSRLPLLPPPATAALPHSRPLLSHPSATARIPVTHVLLLSPATIQPLILRMHPPPSPPPPLFPPPPATTATAPLPSPAAAALAPFATQSRLAFGCPHQPCSCLPVALPTCPAPYPLPSHPIYRGTAPLPDLSALAPSAMARMTVVAVLLPAGAFPSQSCYLCSRSHQHHTSGRDAWHATTAEDVSRHCHGTCKTRFVLR
ncbi:unnamed protein product [Closterium sp. NIES-64]|nr:unnamed protein product [Closterium sp. NIES-64]